VGEPTPGATGGRYRSRTDSLPLAGGIDPVEFRGLGRRASGVRAQRLAQEGPPERGEPGPPVEPFRLRLPGLDLEVQRPHPERPRARLGDRDARAAEAEPAGGRVHVELVDEAVAAAELEAPAERHDDVADGATVPLGEPGPAE